MGFLRRHTVPIVIVAVVVLVSLGTFAVSKIKAEIDKREPPAVYYDDGKGLVYICGSDQVSTFQNFQKWRDDHADRFKQITSTSVGSYWSGEIITYKP